MMKTTIFTTLLMAMTATSAFADAKSCSAMATEKKLAGAALTSFTTKCEADAKTSCEKASADKKLGGAAKTSFEKKCLEDATGHGAETPKKQ